MIFIFETRFMFLLQCTDSLIPILRNFSVFIVQRFEALMVSFMYTKQLSGVTIYKPGIFGEFLPTTGSMEDVLYPRV